MRNLCCFMCWVWMKKALWILFRLCFGMSIKSCLCKKQYIIQTSIKTLQSKNTPTLSEFQFLIFYWELYSTCGLYYTVKTYLKHWRRSSKRSIADVIISICLQYLLLLKEFWTLKSIWLNEKILNKKSLNQRPYLLGERANVFEYIGLSPVLDNSFQWYSRYHNHKKQIPKFLPFSKYFNLLRSPNLWKITYFHPTSNLLCVSSSV